MVKFDEELLNKKEEICTYSVSTYASDKELLNKLGYGSTSKGLQALMKSTREDIKKLLSRRDEKKYSKAS